MALPDNNLNFDALANLIAVRGEALSPTAGGRRSGGENIGLLTGGVQYVPQKINYIPTNTGQGIASLEEAAPTAEMLGISQQEPAYTGPRATPSNIFQPESMDINALRDAIRGALFYKPEDFSSIIGNIPYAALDTEARRQNLLGDQSLSRFVPALATVDPVGYSQMLATRAFGAGPETEAENKAVLDRMRAVKSALNHHVTSDAEQDMRTFLMAGDTASGGVGYRPSASAVPGTLIALDAARGALTTDQADTMERVLGFAQELESAKQQLESSKFIKQNAIDRLAKLESRANQYAPEDYANLRRDLLGEIQNGDRMIAQNTGRINEYGGALARSKPVLSSINPEAIYSSKKLFDYINSMMPAQESEGFADGGAVDFSTLGFGSGKQATLQKFADIIGSGGTLSKGQEAKLANLSGKAGQDLASVLNYTPVTAKYDYVAPAGIASLPTPALPAPVAQATQTLGTTTVGDRLQNVGSALTNLFQPITSAIQNYGNTVGQVAIQPTPPIQTLPPPPTQPLGGPPVTPTLPTDQLGTHTPRRPGGPTGGSPERPYAETPNYDQYDLLSRGQEKTLQNLIDQYVTGGLEGREGKTQKLENLLAKGQLGTIESFLSPTQSIAQQGQGLAADQQAAQQAVQQTTAPVCTPTEGDLYAGLNTRQETRLDRLADLYASGALEGREGKTGKLEELLGKAGLGSLETYFSETPTYTAPTGVDIKLPEGKTLQDVADLVLSDKPLQGYIASQQYGITPEQLNTIISGYQPTYYNPIKTVTDVEDFLARGKSDFVDYNIALTYFKDPENQMFVGNPSLVNRAEQVIYAYQNPIEEAISATTTKKNGNEVAGSGQYGYMNNAPILNARVIEDMFGDSNKVGGGMLNKNKDVLDELGWNFKSGEGLNMITRGVRVVGLNEKVFTPTVLKAIDSGEIYTDPDTGVTVDAYAGERSQLNKAAETLGLDPSKFDSASSLYKAIERATDGMYQVTGQYKQQWDPDEVSEIADKGNHASVLYREVNGQLIPVTDPNLFKYTRPKDPFIGGTVGEILGSTPFLPEVVAFIPGMQAYYPALKTLQTASQSGDIGDVVKSGGMAWLATNFIPKTVGPYLQETIGKIPAIQELAISSPKLANFIMQGGTNAAIAGGLAALTGQDPLEAGLAALAASGVVNVTGQGIDMSNIPDQYKSVVSRIIADTILGKDPKNSLMSIAGAFMKSELKDVAKNTGKTNDVQDVNSGSSEDTYSKRDELFDANFRNESLPNKFLFDRSTKYPDV